MGVAADLSVRAKELIDKYGNTGTLKTNSTTYDPATGVGVVTPVEYNVKLLPFELDKSFKTESTVKDSKLMTYLAAYGQNFTDIPPGSVIVSDGKTYKVLRAVTLIAQDVKMYFQVWVE